MLGDRFWYWIYNVKLPWYLTPAKSGLQVWRVFGNLFGKNPEEPKNNIDASQMPERDNAKGIIIILLTTAAMIFFIYKILKLFKK